MVSKRLQNEIFAFVNEVGEPFGIEVEARDPTVVSRVETHYLPPAISCDEDKRRKALDALRKGWRDNADHGHRRRFGRAAINFSIYVLLPTQMMEIDQLGRSRAIDSVVRISGWVWTDNNRWQRFQPFAELAVREIWGNIDKM